MTPLPDVSRLHRIPERFAATLASCGLTTSFLHANAEPGDDLRGPLRLTRAATYRDDAASIALRLFMGGFHEPWHDQSLYDCGLLTADGQNAHCPFHLRLVDHLYLISDYLGAHDDAVMGAGETTELLYQAAKPEGFAGAVLDLGCGAGTIALLLARRADHVTGTDISHRAIAIAEANARLNGITNASFLTGDCLEPVQGRQFDIIVSQPPYYPADRAGQQVFLSGGPRGDEIARRVILDCPPHLTEEGRALILSSWHPDAAVPHPPNTRVLELYTPVGDVPGTRQSLVILEPAAGDPWFDRFEVPGECWGSIRPHRIDELMRTRQWLRHPHGHLQFTTGASTFTEGQQRFVQARAESLLPTRAISEEEWFALQNPNTAPDPLKRHLVALGWLIPK
ncbi:MAG: methyltransferase [Bryobacterales bacterium]|nr:methyltransferase [Bryobacterales bacterium]